MATASAQSPANPRRIDVHHHIVPPDYLERARDRLERARDRVIASTSTVPHARVCNEYAARLATDHPGRFGTLVALRMPDVAASFAEGALATMKWQFYDIANSGNPATMAAALSVWGPGQLVFGSDNPFMPIAVTASSSDRFTLPDDQRAAIDGGNALRVFPRFGAWSSARAPL